MKPTPKKPRIIIAHVDGSGTPSTGGGEPIPQSPPQLSRRRLFDELTSNEPSFRSGDT
jgi:hypothetical protein